MITFCSDILVKAPSEKGFCLLKRQKDALVFLANAFFLRYNKGIKN